MIKRSSAAIVIAVIAFAAPPAQAQDKAGAEALFDNGIHLYDKGQYAEACRKFAASQKLDAATGTLMNLAQCYEKTGKTASAWATYRDAEALARKEGNPKREAAARNQEVALSKRLATLTITAQSQPGLVVRRDDVVVDSAEWQTALPIDPGAHVLHASAPGKKEWTVRFDVADAANAQITVPALAAVESPPQQPRADHSPPAAAKLSGTRVVALVAGGAGVIGLGLGTYFGLHAISQANDAKAHCVSPSPCDADGRALHDSAGSSADISTISLIAGGALLGTGVVLWLVGGPSSASSSTASAHVRLSPRFGGLALDGSF